MKYLSLSVAVLLLGGVPLSAFAADYGANAALLAASETSASQAPTVPQPRSSSLGAMVGADSADVAADGSAVTPRSTPPGMSPGIAVPPIPGRSASASNKQRAPAAQPSPSTTEVGPATWQSLLPGSIQ